MIYGFSYLADSGKFDWVDTIYRLNLEVKIYLKYQVKEFRMGQLLKVDFEQSYLQKNKE